MAITPGDWSTNGAAGPALPARRAAGRRHRRRPGAGSGCGPGSMLGGRYRLGSRVGELGGAPLWRATDELLGRAVAVRAAV